MSREIFPLSPHHGRRWLFQVRVDAVVALRSFIDAFDTEGLQQVKPLIPQLLDVFFQLMQEVQPLSCSLLSSAFRKLLL